MRIFQVAALCSLLVACAEGTSTGFSPDSGRKADAGKGDTSTLPEEEDTLPGEDTGTGGTKDTGSGSCTPTSGKVCDTFPQCGCASGQNCNVSSTAGATKCVPAGAKGTHEKCTGSGECDKGLQCVANLCVPFCKTDTDCPMANARCRTGQYTPTGSTTPADVPGFDLCLAQCEPTSPAAACGAGTTCFFPYSDDTTECAAAGSSKSKGGCASDTFACAPGYICIDPGDCLKWCRVGFASDCTGTGGTCSTFTTPIMKGGVEYGVCYY